MIGLEEKSKLKNRGGGPADSGSKPAQFRHELKFYINQGEAFLLAQRLRATMDRDKHADDRGEYFIRSLYFDNLLNSSAETKLAGVDARKKYRIRIYNLRDDNIRLECKQKQGQFIHKSSFAIDRKTCDALVAGKAEPLLRYQHPLALEMYTKMLGERLRPVVLIDYMREAFVADVQEVRITFDKDLRTGSCCADLFDPHAVTVKVQHGFDMILEVKFSKYLPAYYHQLLQLGSAERSAISKYVMGRKSEGGG